MNNSIQFHKSITISKLKIQINQINQTHSIYVPKTQGINIIYQYPCDKHTSPSSLSDYQNLNSNKQNNNIQSPSSNSSFNKNFTQVHSVQANRYKQSQLSSKLKNRANLNGIQDNEDVALKIENQQNPIDQLHVIFPPNFFTNLSVSQSMISCMKSYYDCYSQYLLYRKQKKKQKQVHSHTRIKNIQMNEDEKQGFISKDSRELLVSLWEKEKAQKQALYPLAPNKMNSLRAYNVQRQKDPSLSYISQSSLSRITSKHDQINSKK